MKSNLGVSLLLKVSDDALTEQIRRPDDVQYLLIIVAEESEFEAILGRIKGDCFGASSAIKGVDGLALDASKVDWVIESADNGMITNGYLNRYSQRRVGERCLLHTPVGDSI
jgi:hypothetical protein